MMAGKYIVKHRRGTLKQWETSQIIPYAGELVVEIDEVNNLHKLKIGDGVHKYSELAYLKAGDEIVSQVLAQALPHVVTVTLNVDSWIEVTDITDINVGCYKQIIDIADVGDCCRLDLQPDVNMLAEFRELGVSFVTENINGQITIYSVGIMPLKTYIMQATLTETTPVVDGGKILGIPVGASTSIVDWNDIKNKPTSFPAQGGNADTVNGHTVEINVPADAKFTDTTYNAAGSELGLVKSGGDATIIDGVITVNNIPTNISQLNNDSNFTTTTYVDTKVASVVDSSPETLDALNKLAEALGDDSNLATTVITEIGNKVDKVEGKGLSTNDFTNEEKEKLANMTAGEVTSLSIVDGKLCITYEEV